jgi:hypothetical protein
LSFSQGDIRAQGCFTRALSCLKERKKHIFGKHNKTIKKTTTPGEKGPRGYGTVLCSEKIPQKVLANVPVQEWYRDGSALFRK